MGNENRETQGKPSHIFISGLKFFIHQIEKQRNNRTDCIIFDILRYID